MDPQSFLAGAVFAWAALMPFTWKWQVWLGALLVCLLFWGLVFKVLGIL